ncbi:hypothetical protein C8Q75DRAFT_24565 [Abortiporus biennis]|nr:hypothetical protein C8Q75DRAFT_24565 [Abortiporus biennis]
MRSEARRPSSVYRLATRPADSNHNPQPQTTNIFLSYSHLSPVHFSRYSSNSGWRMAAIYTVYTSPTHPPIPNHLPTLIVTPHGQPSNILYSYLHTNFNSENYLLTPSPQGDLCVAKLFPPRQNSGKTTASDPGHSSSSNARVVRCEASRNLKWSITNTGVLSPIYKLSLPSPDSADLPLFQISKPNPNAAFWSMFYFAYAGHNIPPKRIEFGKIQKNPPGPNGGGTRISITGKSPEEKAVWQTLGEGNEDCVEWVVLCAALNLLEQPRKIHHLQSLPGDNLPQAVVQVLRLCHFAILVLYHPLVCHLQVLNNVRTQCQIRGDLPLKCSRCKCREEVHLVKEVLPHPKVKDILPPEGQVTEVLPLHKVMHLQVLDLMDNLILILILPWEDQEDQDLRVALDLLGDLCLLVLTLLLDLLVVVYHLRTSNNHPVGFR